MSWHAGINTGQGYGESVPTDSPWGARPSIFAWVRAHIAPATGAIPPGAFGLPDDELAALDGSPRWAPGARDGVLGDDQHPEVAEARADDVLAAFERAIREPSEAHRAALYPLVAPDDTLGYVDILLEELTDPRGLPAIEVRRLARWLMLRAPDRGAVKLGIAVVGLFPDVEDREALCTLGAHDEFTLFVAVALGNSQPDPVDVMWHLARRVTGWGRIQTVDRIPASDNPELKGWLLAEGWRNTVMAEYSAFACASRGDLAAALQPAHATDAVVRAAGGLIRALVGAGPDGVDAYDDAAEACERFCYHVQPGPAQLAALPGLAALKDYIEDDSSDWDARAERGWSIARRSLIQSRCDERMEPAGWRSAIVSELGSADDDRCRDAIRAARLVGLDIWSHTWARLRERPDEARRWFAVMRGCTPRRLRGVIVFAEETLPLDEIASGPSQASGLDPDSEPNRCLDAILSDLGRFPGQGWSLIRTGLASPVVRNRNLALRALAKWGPDHRPPEAEKLLHIAEQYEPDEDVRERILAILEGRRIE